MANVLLIDDDEMVLETFQIILSADGHSIVKASDGRTGLALCADQQFDAVVTDVVMPEKDGLEVLMTLRKSNPDAKVIVISGGGRTSARDYLEMAKMLGADKVLYKPVTATELSRAITEVTT